MIKLLRSQASGDNNLNISAVLTDEILKVDDQLLQIARKTSELSGEKRYLSYKMTNDILWRVIDMFTWYSDESEASGTEWNPKRAARLEGEGCSYGRLITPYLAIIQIFEI